MGEWKEWNASSEIVNEVENSATTHSFVKFMSGTNTLASKSRKLLSLRSKFVRALSFNDDDDGRDVRRQHKEEQKRKETMKSC